MRPHLPRFYHSNTLRHCILSMIHAHRFCVCCIWISEQTAIVSFCSGTRLLFLIAVMDVYCAVRAESMSTVQVNLIVSACNSAAISSNFTAPNGRHLLSNELVRILQVVILR
jgi:hypothetical protein